MQVLRTAGLNRRRKFSALAEHLTVMNPSLLF